MFSGQFSNYHRGSSTRREYFKRHKPDRDKNRSSGALGWDEGQETASSHQGKSKARADNPAHMVGVKSKHLDLQGFLALPYSVIAEVCKYLHFQDITSLSRASVRLRILFMTKASKRCWDAGRWLQNMPEWTGIAAPRAAAFIFDNACQGDGCEKAAKLRTFYVSKRYCVDCAPTHLLDWDSVAKNWPGIHRDLFYQLPWTNKRASNNNEPVEEGRFVLREDVERLQNRILQIGTEDRVGMGALKRQQKKDLKESQRIAQWMETWTRGYEGRIWHWNNKLFTEFLHGLQKRWGWNLDELQAVRDSPRFTALAFFVDDAQKLDRKVWDRAEAEIKSILEEDASKKRPEHRSWSVSIPRSLQQDLSTPGASSSKGKRR